VFLVNSRLGLVTATLPFSFTEVIRSEGVPLLPKLRGHFAEFLRESYLAPLGILYLPTCVGFGYRCILHKRRSSFSRKYDISCYRRTTEAVYLQLTTLSSRYFFFYLSSPSNGWTGNQRPANLAFSVPRDFIKYSTGILTCSPSTTPFGLALGPDSPSVDEPCGGTLRFSGHWILTNVFVTQADILTSASSTNAYAQASH
jgi:hypothetical protein